MNAAGMTVASAMSRVTATVLRILTMVMGKSPVAAIDGGTVNYRFDTHGVSAIRRFSDPPPSPLPSTISRITCLSAPILTISLFDSYLTIATIK